MQKTLERMLMAVLLLASFGVAAQKSGGVRIECWVDDQGRRMCGDRVPPEYAKKERQVYNARGVVVETKGRQKTPEELAAEERAAQLARELEERKEEQARYDRFLLETYRSVRDLEAMRDDRITTLDARIKLGEKAVMDSEAGLKTLNEQLEAAQKAGKPAEPRLLKQQKTFEKSVAENRRAVETLKSERAQIMHKFEEDIARYRELRPGA